tara:strand:+ start:373 stop:831 length:459 start_codon:yes stop_codon:yes gene_type:complete
MKKKFSKHWNSSKQPRKQRKYRANAPLHIKHKMISANLNKDLRKKYGKRSFPLKKGDSIKIMIGEFKRKTGKVGIVDLKKLRVSIEGIQRTKKDGTKVNVWFSPSNLQIKELNLEDKKRKQALERGKKPEEDKKESEKKQEDTKKENKEKKK